MRWVALIFLCLCLTACHSVPNEDKALASVVFRGNTPGQISRVVDEVFARHGYSVQHTGPHTMLFEKEGSTGSNVLYGNWMGGTPVWIRVKAVLVTVEPGVFRLDCNAFRVRDHGQTLEEEIPFGRLNKGGFQSILNECQEALKSQLSTGQIPSSR